MAGRVPAGVFEELPGFQVEKLFTVPKDELGSWVCITFDNKGRLLASDEGDKGICRITQPPLASSPPGTATVPSPPRSGEKVAEGRMRGLDAVAPLPLHTTVELLDFSKCEFQPTGAQGMLWTHTNG